MWRFASNAHTHSIYGDGKVSPREMADAACAAGFVSLGFSGHANPGFNCKFSMSPENQRLYPDAIRALMPRYRGMRVWLGYELDAITPASLLPTDADYRIGSMHYFEPGRGSPQADGDPAGLRAYTDRVFAGDGLALTQRYYDMLVNFINRERPEIIGHFDLIRKHARRIGLFEESDPAYRKIALCALERVFPSGSVMEINTGGIARGYLPTPYPTLELLCAWREMGGRVTITSDCHDPQLLTCAFDTAHDLLRAAGYKSVLRLGTGDELWDEIEA